MLTHIEIDPVSLLGVDGEWWVSHHHSSEPHLRMYIKNNNTSSATAFQCLFHHPRFLDYIPKTETQDNIQTIYGINNLIQIHQSVSSVRTRLDIVQQNYMVQDKCWWSYITYYKVQIKATININMEKNKYTIFTTPLFVCGHIKGILQPKPIVYQILNSYTFEKCL